MKINRKKNTRALGEAITDTCHVNIILNFQVFFKFNFLNIIFIIDDGFFFRCLRICRNGTAFVYVIYILSISDVGPLFN